MGTNLLKATSANSLISPRG